MPEYPDVEMYVDHLRRRFVGEKLERVRLASPFVVRTFDPPISEAHGKGVLGFRRLGKRIVFELEEELMLVVHLMISGRFRLGEPGVKIPGKLGLAAFDFAKATLILTEASTQKRASIHLLRGEEGLERIDPGGLELFTATKEEFRARMRLENRTLKRALTDPRILSGVGNAYSDEILFDAQLSPTKRTKDLSDAELDLLFTATKKTLESWKELLLRDTGEKFPEKVTAFRPEMAVHGKYGQPCPRCRSKVQRIRYASNESNYCARCQTGGKLLADRSLSRLLKDEWPRTLEELEARERPKAEARSTESTTAPVTADSKTSTKRVSRKTKRIAPH